MIEWAYFGCGILLTSIGGAIIVQFIFEKYLVHEYEKERKKEKQVGRFYSKELLEQANKPIQIIGYHDNNNDFSKYMKKYMKGEM